MLRIPIIGDLIALVVYGLPNVPGNIADAWRTWQLRRRIERVRRDLREELRYEPTVDEIIDRLEAED